MGSSTTSKPPLGHGLVTGIAYGPVLSRRFGRTLGVNLLPSARKHCSFNCVYCQLGWTDGRNLPQVGDYPSPEMIGEALQRAIHLPEWKKKPSCIVVSGNGEPTLHPEFEAAVGAIVRFRDATLPETPLICFTCGTELENESVLRALRLFRECHVKFDADAKRVDLPPRGLDPRAILERAASLQNLVIQSCFMTGAVDNSKEETARLWANTLAKANPSRVDIYTIDRDTAAPGLQAVPDARLREIADLLKAAGIPEVRVTESGPTVRDPI